MNTIQENLSSIREQIEAACARAGRNNEEVRLMAVTKNRSREEVEEVYAAGQRLFGENRVQEAAEKFAGFHDDAQLHLIGHLQSNKAKLVPGLFICVQSVDKLSTAQELDKRCTAADTALDLLLEYNTSGEDAKSGFRSEDDLFEAVDGILELKNLTVRGLMTVGPFTAEEKRIRESFRSLAYLYRCLTSRWPELPMDTLSMGMSGDYDYAVEEGSTLVRIGTAIFGPRDYR